MSRSKIKITRDKKWKSAAFCSGVVLWGTVLVWHFFGAVLGGAVLRQFYAGGKISACCLVINGLLSVTVYPALLPKLHPVRPGLRNVTSGLL